MEPISFTVEFGLYGANYKPMSGALWRVSFYDRRHAQFYAGSADDPFEAIGWALHERELRISNGNHPETARPHGMKPYRALALLRATQRNAIMVPTTPATGEAPSQCVRTPDGSAVVKRSEPEQRPSTSSVPPIFASDAEAGGFMQPRKTAAARRARTKKKG